MNNRDGHIRAQKSWLCTGPNSMKGHLEVMRENCTPEKGALEGEEEVINSLALAIQKAEDFYNAKED